MRYQETRAVVLGSRPLGEADRIIVLFARELGRVDAVVKGVRQAPSRAGAAAWSPSTSATWCSSRAASSTRSRRRSSWTCSRACARIARRSAAAAVVCEATAGLFAEHEPHERVYNLLRNALREARRRRCRAGHPGAAARWARCSSCCTRPATCRCSTAARRAAAAAGAGLLGRARRPGVRALPRRRRADHARRRSAALRQSVARPLAELRALPPCRPSRRRCATCTTSTPTTPAGACARCASRAAPIRDGRATGRRRVAVAPTRALASPCRIRPRRRSYAAGLTVAGPVGRRS